VNEPTNKKGACVTFVLQLGLGNVQNKCSQHELSLALVAGRLNPCSMRLINAKGGSIALEKGISRKKKGNRNQTTL
jgi:hypothetical protein